MKSPFCSLNKALGQSYVNNSFLSLQSKLQYLISNESKPLNFLLLN